MSFLITILSIFSAIASILGVLYLFKTSTYSWFKRWCRLGFILALVISAYVLLVPSNVLEKNVRHKLAVYRIQVLSAQKGVTVTQEGDFVITGLGPQSIPFPIPFAQPPELELIDYLGYEAAFVPTIKTVTQFQFVVERHNRAIWASHVPIPIRHKFKWIAKGPILEEINEAHEAP